MKKTQENKIELIEYSVIVIGAGYAGFSLAKLLMKYNTSVLLIDKDEPGIKSSLDVRLFSFIANKYKGIQTTKFLSIFKPELISAKEEINKSFSKEIFNDTSVHFIKGIPKIISDQIIEVNEEKFKFKKLIFANGSNYKELNFPGITKQMYINPSQILELDSSIETVAIYGTDWISLELGQALTKIGIKVYFVDKNINPFNDFDDDIEATLKKEFKNDLMSWCLESEVVNHNQISDTTIRISLRNGSKERFIEVNKIISTEKTPNSKEIESPFKLQRNKNGAFIIDSSFKMKGKSNFYAIGDINGLNFYPNQGYYHSFLLSQNLVGVSRKLDIYNFGFTLNIEPSISFYGMNKNQIEYSQIPYNEFVYEFKNDYKIKSKGQTGRIKIFTTKKHDIIGAILIGEEVSELINLFSMAKQNNIKFYKFAWLNISFFSKAEFIKEAALEYYYEFVLSEKKIKSKAKKIKN